MSIDTLREFIGGLESRNDLNAVWGRIKLKDRPPRPLEQMTIGQVLDWQDSIDPLYQSEAAGEMQFLEDTLRGLWAEAGCRLSDLFNEETQDKLALALMRRRGLDDYLAGRISTEQFAQNLSKEWASLPCITVDKRGRPAKGQSYYAGDGLNKAHTTKDEFLRQVRKVRESHLAPRESLRPMARPSPPPIPKPVRDLMEDADKPAARSRTVIATVRQLLGGMMGSFGTWLASQPGQAQAMVIFGIVILAVGVFMAGQAAFRIIMERRRKAEVGREAKRAVDPMFDATGFLADPRVQEAILRAIREIA